jgi:hypothetical protein
MVPASVALVVLFGFLLAGVFAWAAGSSIDQRRRDRWDAECREFGCHEPPYDWEKEGSA